MAREEKPKPVDCGTCRGQGGWWEHGNGQPNVAKPKKWIKCWDCNGKGKK